MAQPLFTQLYKLNFLWIYHKISPFKSFYNYTYWKK